MASGRWRSVATALRFVAAVEQGSGVTSSLESTRRAFSSSSWNLPQRDYGEPGLMPSVVPWTYRHPVRGGQEIIPWALQGIQGIQRPQPVFRFSSEEERKDPSRDSDEDRTEEEILAMKVVETRKILQQVNAVALQKRLKSDPRDSFSYRELLDFIKESNVVACDEEAMRFARILDKAGVVLIFRENVYIHPERVAKLVAHALPFAVVPPNDPRRAELMNLEEQKAEIDRLAHRQVRGYLWAGLGLLTLQAGALFRLTYWELSWDVIEPIAFFVTSSGLIASYSYFLFTSRDPSYGNMMHWLFLKRQMNLFKKKKFDYYRYQFLRRQCQCLDPDDNHW